MYLGINNKNAKRQKVMKFPNKSLQMILPETHGHNFLIPPSFPHSSPHKWVVVCWWSYEDWLTHSIAVRYPTWTHHSRCTYHPLLMVNKMVWTCDLFGCLMSFDLFRSTIGNLSKVRRDLWHAHYLWSMAFCLSICQSLCFVWCFAYLAMKNLVMMNTRAFKGLNFHTIIIWGLIKNL